MTQRLIESQLALILSRNGVEPQDSIAWMWESLWLNQDVGHVQFHMGMRRH